MTREEVLSTLEQEIKYIQQVLPMNDEDAQALQDVADYIANKPIRIYGQDLHKVLGIKR